MTAIDNSGSKRAVEETGSDSARLSFARHLFPTAWQERYGVEFGALLAQTPPTGRVLFDILVAAVDAHVHPTGPRRRWPLMIERLRISELVVFATWVVFVVAGLAFQRMTDGPPFATVASTSAAVGWAYAAIVAGALLSLLAVVVAGVPIAVAICRAAIARRRWRQVALLAVPPISLMTWVALTAALLALDNPPAGGPWRVVIFLVWVGVFGLAALASTVAVGAAALDAEVDGALYRRAVTPAFVTAIAMVVVVVAVVAWGIAVALVSAPDFWGSDGILGGSTPLSWLGIVVVMAGASIFAGRAAGRARRALTS